MVPSASWVFLDEQQYLSCWKKVYLLNEMAFICMEQLAIISMQVLMILYCEADYACGTGDASHFYCLFYANPNT